MPASITSRITALRWNEEDLYPLLERGARSATTTPSRWLPLDGCHGLFRRPATGTWLSSSCTSTGGGAAGPMVSRRRRIGSPACRPARGILGVLQRRSRWDTADCRSLPARVTGCPGDSGHRAGRHRCAASDGKRPERQSDGAGSAGLDRGRSHRHAAAPSAAGGWRPAPAPDELPRLSLQSEQGRINKS
jgi:hypothetical protein